MARKGKYTQTELLDHVRTLYRGAKANHGHIEGTSDKFNVLNVAARLHVDPGLAGMAVKVCRIAAGELPQEQIGELPPDWQALLLPPAPPAKGLNALEADIAELFAGTEVRLGDLAREMRTSIEGLRAGARTAVDDELKVLREQNAAALAHAQEEVEAVGRLRAEVAEAREETVTTRETLNETIRERDAEIESRQAERTTLEEERQAAVDAATAAAEAQRAAEADAAAQRAAAERLTEQLEAEKALRERADTGLRAASEALRELNTKHLDTTNELGALRAVHATLQQTARTDAATAASEKARADGLADELKTVRAAHQEEMKGLRQEHRDAMRALREEHREAMQTLERQLKAMNRMLRPAAMGPDEDDTPEAGAADGVGPDAPDSAGGAAMAT